MKRTEADLCISMQQNAIALLGGELTDEEEAAVMQHMAMCKMCREQFRRDRAVWMMLAGCPAPMAAPDFDEALDLRIAEVEREIQRADQAADTPGNTPPAEDDSPRQIPPVKPDIHFPPNPGSIRRGDQHI